MGDVLKQGEEVIKETINKYKVDIILERLEN